MNRNWRYDPDMAIDAIMHHWPATIEVLIRHRMLCVGCPIGGFHTLVEACTEHGIDEAELLEELTRAIDRSLSHSLTG